MDSEDPTGVEYPIPDLLGYFVYPPFNPSLPLGKKMGYAKPSDANNGYIIPIPIFGIPSGNRIPYHFSAGQGNELNLKDNEEIEFELNCYGPDNFEVTKIEKLRPGSLQFEFKTDLDNQDRDQGIILRMPESVPSGQPGKIEYRNNADACQYLDFEMDDIIPLKTISIRGKSEKSENLEKGQKIDFFYAKKKKNSEGKGSKHVAKFIIPYGAQRWRGQVCSLKSGYGFIKRLNVDKEIFFHITQVQNGGDVAANEGGDNKDVKKVQIGDKVDFSIGQHDDREVASQIYILPKNFPMEFDQILQDPFSRQFVDYFGVISKPCDKSNLDQPGVISTDRININYYERDRQNSFTLLENDKVIYNKAIDKRSRKERAINIRLRTDKITEKREKGIVAAVKGSYGFIKRDKSRIDRKNQESRIFFHSSEILDANSKLGRRRIKMGNEVEFTVLPDPIPKTNQRGRCHATRIVHLKPTKNERSKERKPDFEVNTERVMDTHNPEFENTEPICGSIETVARPESPGLIRLKKHMGSGEGPTEAITYSYEEWKKQPDLADLEKGNHVKFQVSKTKNSFQAVNIQRRYSGRVKLTKESYGFVIYKENELFFHSSEASDFESFHKDDIVEFSVRYNDRSDKFNACDVARLSKKRLSMH